MYTFFSWMFFISGFTFSIANIVCAIIGKIQRFEAWMYIILGLGVSMLCGAVCMITTL